MRVPGTVQRRTLARAVPAALALLVGGVAVVPAASAATPSPSVLTSTVYHNPVSRSFADTYADPDVVRGRDGWWYAFATTDPLHSGETTPHFIPMSRSRDLVHWQYMGDAFTTATLPSWADQSRGAALWALPAAGGLLGAVPFCVLTASPRVSALLRARGVAATPEELEKRGTDRAALA